MNLFQNLQFSRDMKPGEEADVDALLQSAFAGPDEAQLVRHLRKDRVIAGEVVLPVDDRIAGYYALSYMVKPKGWLCLAPVAITPNLQRRGYGKRMIGLLSEWARMAQVPVVVMGAPAFYERAGFVRADAGLVTPFSLDHTLLAGMTGPVPTDRLVYPAAFDV